MVNLVSFGIHQHVIIGPRGLAKCEIVFIHIAKTLMFLTNPRVASHRESETDHHLVADSYRESETEKDRVVVDLVVEILVVVRRVDQGVDQRIEIFDVALEVLKNERVPETEQR